VLLLSLEEYMEGSSRYCAACGHGCHCYQPCCEELIGVGMTDKSQACGCTICRCHDTPPDSMVPDSFFKRN